MNLTDNEIIKALEIHSNEQFDNCEGCPYLDGDSCEGFTKYSQPFREVLDLINRKNADVDFYKERANKYEAQVEVLKEQTQKQKAEIERLRKILENRGEICKSCDEKYTEKIKRAKAEAIKEFAERVKQEINFPLAVWKVFDNLVKEMTGETVALKGSKSTGLEKFWQKIKKYCKKNICFFTPEDESELIQYGEKLIKEMVGDEEWLKRKIHR